jgi:hypothetical protein
VTKIQAMQWPAFLDFMKEWWQPGMHGAVVGPTGEGKTTFMKPVLGQRKYVMALDAKGEDDTLEKYGYDRITDLPNGKLPRKIIKDIQDGKPARLVIGGPANSDKADAQLAKLMRDALTMARQQGGWTLYADELQVLGDRGMMNLGKSVERMLVTYRAMRGTVVTTFQAPSWVPQAAMRQISWGAIMPTRDEDMIEKLARSFGRNRKELVMMVHELPPFHDLVITRNVRAPIILVNPPKLG